MVKLPLPQWIQQGRWADVQKHLDAWLPRQADPEALRLLGIACTRQRRHAEALRILDRAQRLAPGSAAIETNRGSVLRQLGQLAAAQSCFERAAALGVSVEIYTKRWARHLEHMLDVLRSSDAMAAARLQTELERRMVRASTKSRPAQSSAPLPPVDHNNMGARQEGLARPEESESPHAPAAGFVVSGSVHHRRAGP